jgi:hypothetical protein
MKWAIKILIKYGYMLIILTVMFKTEHKKIIIGIFLCKGKTECIVQLMLTENSNIYALECQLYLSTKNIFQQKLIGWTQNFEDIQHTRDGIINEHIKEQRG